MNDHNVPSPDRHDLALELTQVLLGNKYTTFDGIFPVAFTSGKKVTRAKISAKICRVMNRLRMPWWRRKSKTFPKWGEKDKATIEKMSLIEEEEGDYESCDEHGYPDKNDFTDVQSKGTKKKERVSHGRQGWGEGVSVSCTLRRWMVSTVLAVAGFIVCSLHGEIRQPLIWDISSLDSLQQNKTISSVLLFTY